MDPRVERFATMSQSGVPRVVVESQMRAAGLDPSLVYPKEGAGAAAVAQTVNCNEKAAVAVAPGPGPVSGGLSFSAPASPDRDETPDGLSFAERREMWRRRSSLGSLPPPVQVAVKRSSLPARAPSNGSVASYRSNSMASVASASTTTTTTTTTTTARRYSLDDAMRRASLIASNVSISADTPRDVAHLVFTGPHAPSFGFFCLAILNVLLVSLISVEVFRLADSLMAPKPPSLPKPSRHDHRDGGHHVARSRWGFGDDAAVRVTLNSDGIEEAVLVDGRIVRRDRILLRP